MDSWLSIKRPTSANLFGLAGRLFLCLYVAQAIHLQAAPARNPQLTTADDTWRVPKNCGPNALYSFLKLNGATVQLDQVLQLTAPGDDGVSLLTLCNASCKLGVPSRVIQVRPVDLQHLQMPVIAHLSGYRDGHFVLLLRANATSLVQADPIRCSIDSISLEAFSRDWSGFILTRQPSLTSRPSFWMVAIGAAVMAFGLVGMCRRKRHGHPGAAVDLVRPEGLTESGINKRGRYHAICAVFALVLMIASVAYWHDRPKRGFDREARGDRESSDVAIRECPIAIPPFAPPESRLKDSFQDEAIDKICGLLRTDDGLNMSSASFMLHFLSFWGLGDRDHKGDAIEGQEMLRVLLDGVKRDWYTPLEPVFYRGSDGLVRSAQAKNELEYDGGGGEAHVDQVLATLGAIGVPASHPIDSIKSSFTVGDAVRSSIRTFVREQELEFSLMAYLRYLPPERQWKNRWGVAFTFDQMAVLLTERPQGTGMCHGTHALFVLAAMLRVQQRHRILGDETVSVVERYLIAASDMLQRSQLNNGAWATEWASRPEVSDGDAVGSLHTTGHHLEWILIAPVNTRPPALVVRKALTWCRQRLANASLLDVRKDVCEYGHAIRALILFSDPDLPEICISE